MENKGITTEVRLEAVHFDRPSRFMKSMEKFVTARLWKNEKDDIKLFESTGSVFNFANELKGDAKLIFEIGVAYGELKGKKEILDEIHAKLMDENV